MDHLRVFIPREPSLVATILARGSAIVASARQENEDGQILVYFEGNIYCDLKTFADKAKQAAGRLATNYPTTAKMLVDVKELIQVGTYCTATWNLHQDPTRAVDIEDWEHPLLAEDEGQHEEEYDPTTLRLELEVAYHARSTSTDWLKQNLRAAFERAIAEGALTGSSLAEVETWNLTVTELPANPTQGQVRH